MAGLPHYRNSKASINNYEPLYKQHFEIIITPPAALGTDWTLVLENVKKVSGLETSKYPSIVEQKFKGATRSYAGGFPDKTSIEISISFEVNLNEQNSAYVLKALRQWTDLIYDPLTGRMGLKKDYVGGPMIISAFNKQGDIYRQWKLPTVFPSSAVPAQDFEYGSNEIWVIEDMKFVADHWIEIIV